MKEKQYHLKTWRTSLAGYVVLFLGIVMILIGFSSELTIWGNFQHMFVSFKSISHFLGTLFLLSIKVGFILLGYFLLKNKETITRFKIDAKGVYYKEMSGSGFTSGAFDLKPFSFLPFTKIEDIYLHKNFWLGYILEIKSEHKRIKLTTANALSERDKKEIYESVKKRLA